MEKPKLRYLNLLYRKQAPGLMAWPKHGSTRPSPQFIEIISRHGIPALPFAMVFATCFGVREPVRRLRDLPISGIDRRSNHHHPTSMTAAQGSLLQRNLSIIFMHASRSIFNEFLGTWSSLPFMTYGQNLKSTGQRINALMHIIFECYSKP